MERIVESERERLCHRGHNDRSLEEQEDEDHNFKRGKRLFHRGKMQSDPILNGKIYRESMTNIR